MVAEATAVEAEVSTVAVAADFMEAAGADFTGAAEDSPAGTLDLMADARLVAEDFAAGLMAATVSTADEASMAAGEVAAGEAEVGAAEAGAADMVTAGAVGAGDMAGAGLIGDMAGDIRMATTATMVTQGITRPTLTTIPTRAKAIPRIT